MKTRDLTLTALLIALTTAATMVIRIPVPATQGYINLGDSMVYVSALLFGPVTGMLAGGIGSALADILGSYTQFAPYTLVIKGLEGFLVGLVAWRLAGGPRRSVGGIAGAIAGIAVGGAVMVAGYFLAESYILGIGVTAAKAEVPGNIFQVVGGLIVAIPAALLLRNVVPSRRKPESRA